MKQFDLDPIAILVSSKRQKLFKRQCSCRTASLLYATIVKLMIKMFCNVAAHNGSPLTFMHSLLSATAFVNNRTFKRTRPQHLIDSSVFVFLPSNHGRCRRFNANSAILLNGEALPTTNGVAPTIMSPPQTKSSLFRVTAKYSATGDQPQAIERLTQQLQQGDKFSVLRGITGTGKTFVMSHVIANIGKPCLVLCHNKTLAAQLARELRSFLSENAVELFVSYYNMYRPEAYIEKSGTYLKKKSSVNAEVDALRHRATRSLLTRNDVVVVASVSCIYGLGFPKEYIDNSHEIEVGQVVVFHEFCRMLERMLYTPSENDENFERGQYQIDDNFETTRKIILWSPHDKYPMRIEFDELQSSQAIDLEIEKSYIIRSIGNGNEKGFTQVSSTQLFPAKHHIVSDDSLQLAMELIEQEMLEQVKVFRSSGKNEEAERLQARVVQDLDLLREHGYCHGCENYSRHFAQRDAGDPPDTLLDYFGFMGKRDWLLIVDESHVTLPQLSAMYIGDRERKLKLVKHGYRLPSALDNRPLNDKEFWNRIDQAVFVSATPSKLELALTDQQPIEMIIRPTFLCDPEIEVRPSEGQLQNFLLEVRKRADIGERTLAIALSQRDAEDMSGFLVRSDVKSKYIHCGLTTNERAEALKELQNGTIDCLVGVNLLREGLDLPQVSLVAIFGADKQGFLRSETAIMQTIGRAARHIEGKAILYANGINQTIQKCIDETNRRRSMQISYNIQHGRKPQSTQGTSTLSIFDLAKKEIDAELEFKVPVGKTKAVDLSQVAEIVETLKINSVKVQSNDDGPDAPLEQNTAFTTDHIPTSPGIYTWRDADDKILYIGKAVNLRSRIRSYHAKSAQHSLRIKWMVKKAASVSFILTPSDRDALVLESNLIKHYQPPYNVLLKDDEHYPYICATCGDDYPKLMIVPMKTEHQSPSQQLYRYFGPYTNFNELNTVMDFVDEKYDLRGKSFEARYSSGSKLEYQRLFEQMMKEVFTEGHSASKQLQELRMEYEHAGNLFESKYNTCRDVVAVGKKSDPNKEIVVVHVLQLREGLVAGRFTYTCTMPKGSISEEDYADAIFTVLTTRHYTSGAESRGKFSWFPDNVLLSHMPKDIKGLRSTIRELGKTAIPKKKSIRVAGAATKGDMLEVDKRTLELAEKNANQAAFERSVGGMNIGIVDGSGALELAKLVGCERPPSRIECYVSDDYFIGIFVEMIQTHSSCFLHRT